jgi:hypothetical protein
MSYLALSLTRIVTPPVMPPANPVLVSQKDGQGPSWGRTLPNEPFRESKWSRPSEKNGEPMPPILRGRMSNDLFRNVLKGGAYLKNLLSEADRRATRWLTPGYDPMEPRAYPLKSPHKKNIGTLLPNVALPTWNPKIDGKINTNAFVTEIDPKRHLIIPMAETLTVPSIKNRNPYLLLQGEKEFIRAAQVNMPKDAKGKPLSNTFLAVQNSSFFNDLGRPGEDATNAHVTVINGVVVATGKLEAPFMMESEKSVSTPKTRHLRTDRNTGSAYIIDTSINRGGPKTDNSRPVQASYYAVIDAFDVKPGIDVQSGFAPESFTAKQRGERTNQNVMGRTNDGRLVTYHGDGSINDAVKVLSGLGIDVKQMIVFDNGPSSFLASKAANSENVHKLVASYEGEGRAVTNAIAYYERSTPLK